MYKALFKSKGTGKTVKEFKGDMLTEFDHGLVDGFFEDAEPDDLVVRVGGGFVYEEDGYTVLYEDVAR